MCLASGAGSCPQWWGDCKSKVWAGKELSVNVYCIFSIFINLNCITFIDMNVFFFFFNVATLIPEDLHLVVVTEEVVEVI